MRDGVNHFERVVANDSAALHTYEQVVPPCLRLNDVAGRVAGRESIICRRVAANANPRIRIIRLVGYVFSVHVAFFWLIISTSPFVSPAIAGSKQVGSLRQSTPERRFDGRRVPVQ